jgi:hypothetical protein
MLGIDPAGVTVRDDPVRRYGARYPVPLLHVPDASATAGDEHDVAGSPGN